LVSTKYHFDYDNLRFWQLKISFTHTSTDMGKRKSADELSTNPYTAKERKRLCTRNPERAQYERLKKRSSGSETSYSGSLCD
jgi:hypothetical protein